jgi:hypothetical protein
MNIFTIYRITITNDSKEEQYLNYFNGNTDLLEIGRSFYDFLSKNTIQHIDSKGNKRSFSISDRRIFSNEGRYLDTNLDSAYTGETFEIRDGKTNGLSYPVAKTDLQSRKLFSLLYIPENKKHGYVVFENKSNHGVKIVFEQQFNKFLKESGFSKFRLELKPGLNFNFLSNMIEKGFLKKVRLINYEFSKPVQLSLWNELNMPAVGNEEIRELNFSKKTNSKSFKDELYSLFFSKLNVDERIHFRMDFESDEISFVINFENSSKTFYIKNKSKMRSNIDVSGRLEYLDDGPTYTSKVKVALELINEIQDYGIDDKLEVA